MKHFAIALDNGSSATRNNVTSFMKGTNWAFWHWIDDLWIVVTPDDLTAQELHDAIDPLINEGVVLVFEFSGEIKFWGRNDEEAWEWLEDIGTPGI